MLLRLLILLFLLFVFSGCSSINKRIKSIKKIDTNVFDKQVRAKNYLFTRWAKNLDPVYNSGNRPIGSASPLIHDDMLFMGSLGGKISAYHLDRGSLMWSKDHDEGQVLNAKASFYKDSIIYGSMTGRLFSRKYISGKLNYSIDLGAPIESAPVIDNGKLFIHLRNHKIVALDAQTGKIFWSYKRSVPFKITLQRVSEPLVYGDSIIVGFADGHIVRLTKLEGVIKWDMPLSKGVKFVDVDTTPVLYKGKIVAGSANGYLSFVNPRNGFVTKTLNTTISAKPIVVDDELYVGSIFGELVRFDSSGQVIMKKKVSKFPISSVVKWHDKLAVSTMGEDLMILDTFTLKKEQSKQLGTEISSVFGIIETDGEYLGIYSSRNRLYVFKRL